MAIKGWIRVSTEKQDRDNQRHAILEYCNTRQWYIDANDWFELTMSTRKKELNLFIQKMIDSMDIGDTLIVSELSRLGRSMEQMIRIIHELHQNQATIIAIKENMTISGNGNISMSHKIMIMLFSLLYDLEREFISLRTKEALAMKKKAGVRLGRPKGNGKSRLDGKETYIQELLGKQVSKASIAKILDVSRPTLVHFIQTRGL